ncbi:MAG TPA: hypothetical protein VNB90_02155 [Cytophagaceae bacterium]|nr:hypothetical protein [Cytophagaceae bacterium]
MKKINLAFLGATMIAFLTLTTGCKKDKKDTAVTTTANAKPNDQQGSTEADAVISDVNDFISNKMGGGSNMKVGAYNLPCGVVSVDSSTNDGSGHKIYKFQYGNQTACGYKKKSGQVSFALTNATAFNTAGATFTLTFTDYVVEVVATGSIVTLNGTITIVNQTGYYIWEPVSDNTKTVTHKVRGAFTVKYSDNTERTRNYYQLRTWANSKANNDWTGISLTIAGDSINGSHTYYEIGKTYEGNYDYQSEMLTNFVWSNCGTTWAGPYLLKQGHARMNVTVPLISPAYIDVEGGYHWDYSNATATPTLVNDCSTNAYKITTVITTATTTQYQLY